MLSRIRGNLTLNPSPPRRGKAARLLWLILLFVAAPAFGIDVRVAISNSFSQVTTNRKVLVTPLSRPSGGAGTLLSGDRVMFNTSSNSYFWISNATSGYYVIELQIPPDKTSWEIFVDTSNAVQYAERQTVASSTAVWPPGNTAWSISASDLRYLSSATILSGASGLTNGQSTAVGVSNSWQFFGPNSFTNYGTIFVSSAGTAGINGTYTWTGAATDIGRNNNYYYTNAAGFILGPDSALGIYGSQRWMFVNSNITFIYYTNGGGGSVDGSVFIDPAPFAADLLTAPPTPAAGAAPTVTYAMLYPAVTVSNGNINVQSNLTAASANIAKATIASGSATGIFSGTIIGTTLAQFKDINISNTITALEYSGGAGQLAEIPPHGPEIWNNQPLPVAIWSTYVPQGAVYSKTNTSEAVLIAMMQQAKTNGLLSISNFGIRSAIYVSSYWCATNRATNTAVYQFEPDRYPTGIGTTTTALHTNGMEYWLDVTYTLTRPTFPNNQVIVAMDQGFDAEQDIAGSWSSIGKPYINVPGVTPESCAKDFSTFYASGVDGLINLDKSFAGDIDQRTIYRSMIHRQLCDSALYCGGRFKGLTNYFGNAMSLTFWEHFDRMNPSGAFEENNFGGDTNSDDETRPGFNTYGTAFAVGHLLKFYQASNTKSFPTRAAHPIFDLALWGTPWTVATAQDWQAVLAMQSMWHASILFPWPFYAATNTAFQSNFTNANYLTFLADPLQAWPTAAVLNNSNSVWVTKMNDASRVRALFVNEHLSATTNLTVSWSQIGVATNTLVNAYDGWTGALLGSGDSYYTVTVGPHASVWVEFRQEIATNSQFANSFLGAQSSTMRAWTQNGNALTNLNATNLIGSVNLTNTFGILPIGQLATNTPWTGTFLSGSSATSRYWTQDGGTLTNLNATNLLGNVNLTNTFGLLPIGQLATNTPWTGAFLSGSSATSRYWTQDGGTLTNVAGGGGSGWSLTGNSGITAANYLGTSDTTPLVFKIAGVEVGRFSKNAGFSLWDVILGWKNTNSALPGNNAVIGGSQNAIQGVAPTDDVIAGGLQNTIGRNGSENGFLRSSIFGGSQNIIYESSYATILGGSGNLISNSANYATVAGGQFNVAGGAGSFAAGTSAIATNLYSFVWGDGVAVYGSTNAKSFNVQAGGGVRFNTSGGGGGIKIDDVPITNIIQAGAVSVLANSPTIVTPTIASFVNATHNHQNAAGGGALDGAAIGSGTVVAARLGISVNTSFSTLTDGATITWTCDSTKNIQNAKVTLGGARTLAFASTTSGMTGVLIVVQDGSGGRSLALPGGSKVIGGGAGAITLTATAGAIDVLTWVFDGSNYYWNYGKNYN